MNTRRFCDREAAVVAAFHAGTMTEGLLAHIEQCDCCAEVVLVASSLQKELAATLEVVPPDATVVWQRSLAFARKKAISKAMIPIHITQIGAVVITIAAAFWMSLGGPNAFSALHLGWQQLWIPDRSLSDLLLTSILWAIIPSMALISLSSWYLLRQE